MRSSHGHGAARGGSGPARGPQLGPAVRPGPLALRTAQDRLREKDFLRSIDGVDAQGLFARAEAGEFDGVPIRVIALDDLIANKKAVGRPQDLLDVEFLERVRARR